MMMHTLMVLGKKGDGHRLPYTKAHGFPWSLEEVGDRVASDPEG